MFLSAVLKLLEKENVSVDVYLAGESKMKFLNKKFRGKDTAANVLSFKEPENFPHPELADIQKKKSKLKYIGEIYLNTGSSRKKSVDLNSDEEISQWNMLLLAHGLLHLLGYSHENEKAMKKMESKEQEILNNKAIKKYTNLLCF